MPGTRFEPGCTRMRDAVSAASPLGASICQGRGVASTPVAASLSAEVVLRVALAQTAACTHSVTGRREAGSALWAGTLSPLSQPSPPPAAESGNFPLALGESQFQQSWRGVTSREKQDGEELAARPLGGSWPCKWAEGAEDFLEEVRWVNGWAKGEEGVGLRERRGRGCGGHACGSQLPLLIKFCRLVFLSVSH